MTALDTLTAEQARNKVSDPSGPKDIQAELDVLWEAMRRLATCYPAFSELIYILERCCIFQ